MESLIEVENVRYRYSGGQWVLRDVDFSIDEGEYVAICGTNGSGKSTIGYLFNGLIPHFFDGELRGRVTVGGIDTRTRPVSDLFSAVGLVLQNADAQLFNGSVENEIAFGLESLGLSAAEIDRRLLETAGALGIEHLLLRSPMSLSGGEKRLAAIASVVCLEPKIVLLDEPFANLDLAGVERVREVLKTLHRNGRTVVVIEQRMDGFLDDITRCLILENGRVRHDTGRKLARTLISEEKLIPSYPPRKPNSRISGAPVILEARGLSCRAGRKQILENIDFKIRQGETVALVSQTGAGKTTLIRHLNGLAKPTRGEIRFEGEPVGKKPPSQMAWDVGLSFQNPNDQFFKNQVRDELEVGLKRPGDRDDGWIEKLCDLFGLTGLLDRTPHQLSEGEKKRVALASILAMKPKLLVLDEPTVGQDGPAREKLASLLLALEDQGFTSLIVTHDMDFARAAAHRWLVLENGTLNINSTPKGLGPSKGRDLGAKPPAAGLS